MLLAKLRSPSCISVGALVESMIIYLLKQFTCGGTFGHEHAGVLGIIHLPLHHHVLTFGDIERIVGLKLKHILEDIHIERGLVPQVQIVVGTVVLPFSISCIAGTYSGRSPGSVGILETDHRIGPVLHDTHDALPGLLARQIVLVNGYAHVVGELEPGTDLQSALCTDIVLLEVFVTHFENALRIIETA